jgi:hypothetical protein
VSTDLPEISDRADDGGVEREHLAVLAEVAEQFTSDQLRGLLATRRLS